MSILKGGAPSCNVLSKIGCNIVSIAPNTMTPNPKAIIVYINLLLLLVALNCISLHTRYSVKLKMNALIMFNI